MSIRVERPKKCKRVSHISYLITRSISFSVIALLGIPLVHLIFGFPSITAMLAISWLLLSSSVSHMLNLFVAPLNWIEDLSISNMGDLKINGENIIITGTGHSIQIIQDYNSTKILGFINILNIEGDDNRIILLLRNKNKERIEDAVMAGMI